MESGSLTTQHQLASKINCQQNAGCLISRADVIGVRPNDRQSYMVEMPGRSRTTDGQIQNDRRTYPEHQKSAEKCQRDLTEVSRVTYSRATSWHRLQHWGCISDVTTALQHLHCAGDVIATHAVGTSHQLRWRHTGSVNVASSTSDLRHLRQSRILRQSRGNSLEVT